jgi:hypothetical protein
MSLKPFHGRKEFRGCKRFGNMASNPQTPNLVFGFGHQVPRHHEDRHPGAQFHGTPDHFEPVLARHLDIGNHQVERLKVQLFFPVRHISRGKNRMAFGLKDSPAAVDDDGVVIDDQYVHNESFSSVSAGLWGSLSEPLVRATGVALRQQSLPIGVNTLDFFLRFIAEFGGCEDDYLPYLECALSVMSAHSGDPDVRDLLANTLSSCRRHLDQITAGEEMLRKSTMETLMHQGIRVASVPPDVLREKIAMLRQILIRVFGWTDPDRSAPAEIDLGDHHGPGSMEAVIKLLS